MRRAIHIATTKIRIPASVTLIGAKAFASCKNLKNIQMEATAGWSFFDLQNGMTAVAETDMQKSARVAEYLTDYRSEYYWRRA